MAIVFVVVALALGGCATMGPLGPTVAVMPAPGKPLDVFQQEDVQCREYAFQAIGGQPAIDAAQQNAIATAAVSAIIGTAAGALIGTGFGDAGAGAAVGAGAGLATGGIGGATNAQMSATGLQQRYNLAYMQCMYTKGNQVPGVIH